MAIYWASKTSLPDATSQEMSSPSFVLLKNLSEDSKGISVAQGQADIDGAIEMLGALQYHYQNFLEIVRKKVIGEIEFDAPDERFEAVAYLNRIGQLCYFSTSPFVSHLYGKTAEDFIPSAYRLIPFRHKYLAHRERDKPLRNSNEATELNGELALGALGGRLFCSRTEDVVEKTCQETKDPLRLISIFHLIKIAKLLPKG
jgi:hypothetical protein